MMCPAKRLVIVLAAWSAVSSLSIVRAQDGLAGDLDDLLGAGGNAAKAPAAEAPAAEAPAAEAPAAEAPAAEAPAVEAPAAEAPAAGVGDLIDATTAPAAAAPAVEAPAAEAPVVEAPVVEAPAAVPATTPAVAPAAADGTGNIVSEIDTLEQMRRKALEEHGKSSLNAARKALRDGDYLESKKLYEEALTFIGARPGNEKLREEAEEGVAESLYRHAKLLRKKGDRDRAAQLARQAREKGHPKAPALVADIQKEIDNPPKAPPPKVTNRWNADEYKEDQAAVSRGLSKARQYYITGEYAQARDELEVILRDHPYDAEAMQLLRRVNERTYDVSSTEFSATRTKMIGDVRGTWNPQRYAIDTGTFEGKIPTDITGGQVPGQRDAAKEILEKMQSITLPEINFRAANINDVMAFFETASREFDNPDLPPEKRGVNFVLKLTGGAAPAARAPASDDPFANNTGAAVSGINPITFSARYVSLLEALKIVTDVAGMKYRIRGSVVMVMPLNIADEDIVTRSYTVISDLPQKLGAVSRELTPVASGAGGPFMEATEAAPEGSVDWKRMFGDLGVQWPDGSSISHIPSIGKLRVANTAENLAVLENVLKEFNVTPSQIEIEARFVEVSQKDLESIGVEWLLTDDWQVARQNGGASPSSTPRIDVSAGSGSAGALRSLSDGALGSAVPAVADGVLGVASVLTNPELSFVLHMLSQRQNTDLLSAPKVVTKAGQEAVIKVVTEYIYPTEFETELLDANAGNGLSASIAVGAVVTPQNFEMREVGVILQVVPEVSAEGQMIDLFLNPQIVGFQEWKNYGSELPDPVNGGTIQLKMEQPFFNARSISTRISIYNGATVVMGGMITEGREEVDDKVPVLGDVPLLGRLFRSRFDQSIKRNLLIFVTARLVDPAGRTLKAAGGEGEQTKASTP